MQGVHFAPAPYCFSCPIGHTYPACKRGGDTLACISAMEHLIRTLGPDSIAAVVAEPIFGVGMFHPPEEYLPQLRELTREYGILWIDDEVMTGFGRTGKTFAYQHSPGVTPDLMALGKGMISATLPAGGVVMSRADQRGDGPLPLGDRQHVRRAPDRDGRGRRRTSSGCSRSACPSGRPRSAPTSDGVCGSCATAIPSVAEVAGAGLLWAVELVRPDGSGERFAPDDRHALPAGQARVLARRSSSRASARSAASRSRRRRRTRSASARR